MRNVDLTIRVNKKDLLEKLRVNLKEHKQIYKEAVEGFKGHAKKELDLLLSKCDGRQNVYLHLEAPQDHSSAYQTVIGMLEMATDEEIELGAGEFRNFVEDKWDWMENWLVSNSRYSGTAAGKLNDI